MAEFGSDSTITRTTRTNTTFPAPEGIEDGDGLVIVFEIAANGGPPTPTEPTDFALLSEDFPAILTDGGGFVSHLFGWGKLANGESGDYTITHSEAITGGWMVRIPGAALTDTFLPEATVNAGGGNPATALGFTTVAPNTLVIWYANYWDPGSVDAPSGNTPTFTNRFNPTSGNGLHIATGTLAVAGATGDKTSVPPGSPWVSGLIAVAGVAASPGNGAGGSMIDWVL